MSHAAHFLHSHSGIEKDNKFPKNVVLVDEEYKHMFKNPEPYVYNEKTYYKVPTIEFVNVKGHFKCYYE